MDTAKKKNKIKNIFIVTILFLFLNLAFNNCGQPGEIKMQIHSSTPTPDNSSAAEPSIPPVTPPETVTPSPGLVIEPPPSTVVIPTPAPPSEPNPIFVVDEFKEMNYSFNVSESEKVDILFVVDNSISMNYEQSNMADRFHRFLDSLNGLDWQIGIVTTDVSDPYASKSDGKLLIFDRVKSYILNSKMDKVVVEQAFSETIQQNNNGSSYEQGIFATYRFLERDIERSEKLIRDGSSFSVVIVSDADETPWENAQGKPIVKLRNKPDELVKFIKNTWAGKKFQFHSIVVKDKDEKCLQESQNEGFGLKYIYLSNLTGGIVGSVCEKDYGSQLKFMGEKVKDLVKSVVLECEPQDTNQDHIADVKIQSSLSFNGVGQIEIDRIEKRSLFFKGDLPAGQYTVNYYCKKP